MFALLLRFIFQLTEERITLTDDDHDDLVKIVTQVLPHAPQFQNLLHSQLRNSKSKDPRHRRWDVNMISLCLNLWAK